MALVLFALAVATLGAASDRDPRAARARTSHRELKPRARTAAGAGLRALCGEPRGSVGEPGACAGVMRFFLRK